MFADRLRTIALLLLLGIATTASARADGPGADFKLDAEATATSPDEKIRIEPYFKKLDDGRSLYQFWTFDADHQHRFLLNPGEGDDVAGYAAGFRFSPDSQWLVRMQKLGAGYHTLYLYRRNGLKFSPATKNPLGELAWDYFLNQPTARRMDMKTASFSVPADFAEHNAKAVKTPGAE
jgi:hypothetical protein